MEKNLNILYKQNNLLNNPDFLSLLRFEADYANTVKGGNLPYYYSKEKRVRLTNPVNFLSSSEQKEIIYSFFISLN